MPSVAFVINRPLIRDRPGFLRRCQAAARAHGWEPTFAETSPAEPGLGLARHAVAAGARLVFAAGGDGTVRACAQALSGTGIPLAIVPLGTANLIARALGIPSRAERALEAGFGGRDRQIDLAVALGHLDYIHQPHGSGGHLRRCDAHAERGEQAHDGAVPPKLNA